jgi:hypothetical protein
MKLVEAMDKSPFGMAYAVAHKTLVMRPPVANTDSEGLFFTKKGHPDNYNSPIEVHWTRLEDEGYTDMNWMPVTGICTLPEGGDSFEV